MLFETNARIAFARTKTHSAGFAPSDTSYQPDPGVDAKPLESLAAAWGADSFAHHVSCKSATNAFENSKI